MDGGTAGRATNKLSDRAIKSFIAKAKAGKATSKKLSDGGGMFLMLTPAGTPVWRLKYRYPDPGKGLVERLYAIGEYGQPPKISLEAARAERDEIKAKLREGRDPVQVRKLNKIAASVASAQSFEELAGDWLTIRRQNKKWSDVHFQKSKQALERDVFPLIGKLPVAEITPAMVSAVMEKIAKRGVFDTVGKIYEQVRAIFRLALARGMREDNPAEPVREVLPGKKSGRMPAMLKFTDLGDVLRRAELSRLSPAVRMAHRLCAFTGARISNIVLAEWPEFRLDDDVPTWIIPRKKMKAQDRHHDHKIILGPTIAAELRSWRSIAGAKGYLFPSPTDSKHPITRESIEKAYRVTLNLADKHSPHGWRSALSTLARDNGFERDVVELSLDHTHDNDVVRAYDRGERLEQRIKLMNWWDAQLAQAQRGADVISMKASA